MQIHQRRQLDAGISPSRHSLSQRAAAMPPSFAGFRKRTGGPVAACRSLRHATPYSDVQVASVVKLQEPTPVTESVLTVSTLIAAPAVAVPAFTDVAAPV